MKDQKIWEPAPALLHALRSPETLSADIRKAGRRMFGIAGSGDVDSDIAFGTAATYDVDDDPTLAADSDDLVPTQAAVKAYADQLIAANNAMVPKGTIDCSANPNYPAADCGWLYLVGVAGKIGGASGPTVEVGDMLLCLTDGTASGNHATVGANWNIVQANLVNALTTASIGVTVQAQRTITGTANKVSVTNGDGVSGDPTLSLPDDLVVGASITLPNTGLHILDTNASHDLIVAAGSNLTADRTLTITTGDANRTLDISASSVTVSAYGASLVDDADQAAAQATLGLVPTSSILDATAGRVLKVSDFGIGNPLNATSTTPFSTYDESAGFIHNSSTVNSPSDWPTGGESWYGFTVNTAGGQRGAQLLVGHSSGRVYARGHASGSYTSWIQLADLSSSQTVAGTKTFSSPIRIPTYTVATVPSAATYSRGLIYVSDGTSNKRLAISDGTNWRWPDGAIVS